jgi:signal recognition particle subunit SEC65
MINDLSSLLASARAAMWPDRVSAYQEILDAEYRRRTFQIQCTPERIAPLLEELERLKSVHGAERTRLIERLRGEEMVEVVARASYNYELAEEGKRPIRDSDWEAIKVMRKGYVLRAARSVLSAIAEEIGRER